MLYRLTFFLSFLFSNVYAQITYIQQPDEKMFQDAMELWDKEKFAAAQKKFGEYIERGSNGEKAIQARFYQGVCALKLDNSDAETLISGFVQSYPSHPLAYESYRQLGHYYFEKGDYKTAVSFYDRVDIQPFSSPEKIENGYRRAYAYFQLNKYGEAGAIFNQIKLTSSEYARPAAYYAGYLAYLGGNYTQALSDLGMANNDPTFGSKSQALMAAIYYKQKRYSEVLAMLPAGDAPVDPELALIGGECHFLAGNFEQAHRYFGMYLKAYPAPTDRGTNYRIGYTFLHQKNAPEAQKFLEKAADGQDTLAQAASYHVGIAYLDQQAFNKAITAFDQSRNMNFNPQLKEGSAYYFVKANHMAKSYAATIQGAEFYVQNFPTGPNLQEVYNLLGDAYQNTGDYEKAMNYLGRIPNKSPEVQRLYQKVAFNKAALDFNDEKYTSASTALRSALVFNADPTILNSANFWLGEIYSASGKYDSALIYYEQVRTNAPEYGRALFGKGYALFNTKNYSGAIPVFQQYMRLNLPENRGEVLLRLADCYYVTKNFEQAVANYNQLIQLKLGEPDYIYFHRGLAFRSMNQLNDAVASFDQVVNLNSARYKDQALYQLADINLENGRNSEAVRLYTRLVNETPNSTLMPYALAKRAVAANLTGNQELAANDYKRIIDQFITYQSLAETAIEGLQQINSNGYPIYDLNQYMNKFSATYKESEVVIKGRFDIAQKPFVDANYPQAVTSLSEFIRSNPLTKYTYEAYYMLGFSFEALKDFNNAIESYKKVQGTFLERTSSRLADLYYQTGKYQEAIAVYAQMQKTASNARYTRSAILGQMRSYFMINDYDATLQFANAVAENKLTRDLNEAELYKGKVMLAQRKFDDAIGQFQRTVKLGKDKNAAEAQYLIGKALREQGQFEVSTEQLIKVRSDFETYEEWIYEAFLLIAENYVSLGNTFQAKATLNSIIEYSKEPSITERAKKRLAEL